MFGGCVVGIMKTFLISGYFKRATNGLSYKLSLHPCQPHYVNT